jgi:subtilisin family serine protease
LGLRQGFHGFVFFLLLAVTACRGQGSARSIVYVFDTFGGPGSHGENVAGLVRKACFEACEVRKVDLGRSIDRRKYLESLARLHADLELHRQGRKRVVLNLSFGSYTRDAVEERLLSRLAEKGVVIIASAGNDGWLRPMFPAAYEDVVAVAATDRIGGREAYSNYGPHIGLSAPGRLGVEIQSRETRQRGTRREQRITFLVYGGTSFAAPRVSGLIGYLLERLPEKSPRDVVALVKARAVQSGGRKLGAGEIRPLRTVLANDSRAQLLVLVQGVLILIGLLAALAAFAKGNALEPGGGYGILFIAPLVVGLIGVAAYILGVRAHGLFRGGIEGAAVVAFASCMLSYRYVVSAHEARKRLLAELAEEMAEEEEGEAS